MELGIISGVATDAMKKIVFYGDSNTYGYDPRGYLGMRYPQNLIWTSGVSQYYSGKYDVIEEGMNGRLLPSTSGDTSYLKGLLADIFAARLMNTTKVIYREVERIK